MKRGDEDENGDAVDSDDEEKDEKKKNMTKKAKKKEKSDGVDDNIFASLYMILCYGSLTVTMFVKEPMNPRYLYSTYFNGELPFGFKLDGDPNEHWLLYLWIPFEYLHIAKFCLTFNNAFYHLILYAHCTNFWLFQLSR